VRVQDPRAEYAERLKAREAVVALEERAHIRLGYFKLLVIAVGLVMMWLAWHDHYFSGYWIFAALGAYVALAIWHERVLRARSRADAAAAYYRRGILRIEDRWQESGTETGERFRDANHPYSEDLDIFGKGSLFELLTTARTQMGERRLADWLRAPADAATIRERQQMIAELREKLDLREAAAVIGMELRPLLDADALAAWAENEARLPSAVPMRYVAAFLAIAAGATGILYLTIWPLFPFLAVLMVNLLAMGWLQKRASAIVDGLASNSEGLKIFAEILERVEQEEFSSARLQALKATLAISAGAAGGGVGSASGAVRRLARIDSWIQAREGYGVKLLEPFVLYTIQCAYAADAWRARFGASMRKWLDAVAEIEALLSLATYSYEHPKDPFAEIVETGDDGEPIFHGANLGHPLIAAAVCVRNPVCLDARSRVLLVSGSNMSGKSTYMRTAGVNAVLALCGAPIRGDSLRITPLNVGTRLRTADSLQEGRSGFYSEVLRIRTVFELVKRELPVMFFFDELLEGTNSHDRRIGAEGLLRALLAKHTIGIVTTHDLALTEVVSALGPQIHNVHFQDYVEGGKMRFDYRLQEGVVARSNAIELMRIVGLDV
jgi:hypothetical protein